MSDGEADVSRRGFLRTAAGATAVATATGTAAAQEEGGGGGEEVVVGPNNELVFDPETVEVTPGTTVLWTWDSDNHNIVVDEQPEDASWEGTEGGPDTTYDTGHEYSYTFETEGTYEYACEPHRQAGMLGTVEVSEDAGGGGGSQLPQVPDAAKSLGVASTMAMVATLGLTFFFLKYGGDYESAD